MCSPDIQLLPRIFNSVMSTNVQNEPFKLGFQVRGPAEEELIQNAGGSGEEVFLSQAITKETDGSDSE